MDHHTAAALVALVLTTWLPSNAAAKATITEEQVDGQPAVAMENDFVRLVVQPGKGGQCTDFVYKPTGKRFVMPRGGSLLGNRVWNYMDSDLYKQWQECSWAHQIERRDGEVALILRAAGDANFTKSTQFEKRVVLRDGESMARVTTTFHVGQELMQPFSIGLWFANMTGVVGEQSNYFFPLDDGILKLDLATATGQEWLYNPSRGWAALVGESGTGLCFDMEYRRLMCFYLWPGKQPTVEWAFRTTEVENGGSVSTEQLLVPFAGMSAVHGSGGGVVAEIAAPDTCTLQEATKGLPVRALLAPGAPIEGELTLALKPLPDGDSQELHRGKVSLQPGKPFEVEVTVKPPNAGTYLLVGSLSQGEQELMDFVKPLIVGEPSAPVRIAPKEERLGRKSERFEDRVALSGGGPQDLELSMEVESPHVKWARPYSQGKMKVLVLTSCISGREAVELAQRVDIEPIWVTAGTQSELSGFSWVWGLGRKFTYGVDRMNENIKQKLTGPCDAIIIGGLQGGLFTDEVVELFRRKVSEGVGLVYVAPNRGNDELYSLLPVERETRPRDRNGQWQATGAHFITTGVPLDELPPTDYARYEATGDVLAEVGKHPLVVAQDGPGKGRVVVLSYNTSWQGSGSHSYGMTPWVEQSDYHFPYWEYHFSLLAKSLLWAGRKESSVELTDIAAAPAQAGPELTLTLTNPGAPVKAQVEVALSDRYGVIEQNETREVAIAKGTGPVAWPLRQDIPGGLHLVDAILRDAEGKVITWGSVALRMPEGVGINEVTFDKRAYYPGDTAKATVRIAVGDKLPADAAVRAELTDSLGRLLARQEKPLSYPTSFELAIGNPLTTTATLRVTALVDGQPNAVAQQEVITFPERFAKREWGDWESCIWGSAGGAYRREYLLPVYAKLYRDYGVSTCLASGSWQYGREFEWPVRHGFRIMPMNVSYGAISVGKRVPKGKMTFAEQKLNYQKTHDKQYLVRPVCLNSDEDLDPLAGKLRQVAEYAGWLEPIGYNLGDEMSTTHYVTPYDYDFHPDALGAFREWLKEQYSTLDSLNAEWDTEFVAWADVMPMTAHEVQGRGNYAPWADHREFMDVAFSNFFKWTRERLREKDPKAAVGMSGSQAAEAYGGYDWFRLARTLDFIQNYTHKNTPIMQESFAPDLPRAPWYGYTMRNPAARQRLWWRLFSGNYGGSYWSATFMFRPDLLPSPMTADMAPVVKEFQSGIAKLLRNLDRQTDIGIHYSHASIRGAFISQQAALFSDNREGWVKCLEDLGHQCEFLATPELEAGELTKRNYAAFVLPYSVALSEKEAVALRQYVEKGGLLLADAKTGMMDEHCKTLGKARLEDVFGIARDKPDPLCASREGEVRLTRDSEACKLAGLSLDVSAAEPDVKVRDGQASGTHGETPAAVVKQLGKGHAVFLNLFFDTYTQRRGLNVESQMLRLCENLLRLNGLEPAVDANAQGDPAPHLYTARYTDGEALYVGTVMDAADKETDWSTGVAVKFPKAGFLYDARQQKPLGRSDRATTTLLAGGAALFAVLPYEVTGVTVAPGNPAVARGKPVEYTVTVQAAGGKPGQHVVLVEVLDPKGEPRPHYNAQLLAQDGRATGQFVPALNDPTGRWTIRGRDWVSGKAGAGLVDVRE